MKVLVIDDHALFRDGLHYALKAIDSSIVLLQADSLSQAKITVEKHPDLVILLIDLEMPVNDGFETLDIFTTLYPTLPCVILSASTKRNDVNKAIDAGALGFISKNSPAAAMHNAMSLILAGEIYVPHSIMYTERRINREKRIDLTPRQRQVMSLVIEGCPNKIIAAKLDLAEPTVKMHLSAIFEKLNVHNRSAAIAKIREKHISLVNTD